jgi:hypothetical protein
MRHRQHSTSRAARPWCLRQPRQRVGPQPRRRGLPMQLRSLRPQHAVGFGETPAISILEKASWRSELATGSSCGAALGLVVSVSDQMAPHISHSAGARFLTARSLPAQIRSPCGPGQRCLRTRVLQRRGIRNQTHGEASRMRQPAPPAEVTHLQGPGPETRSSSSDIDSIRQRSRTTSSSPPMGRASDAASHTPTLPSA